MNAEGIIFEVLREELMKHVLIPHAKKCSCEKWRLPGRAHNYGTLSLQHADHVAAVVAKRLSDRTTYREQAA